MESYLKMLDMKRIDEAVHYYTHELKDYVEENKRIFGYSPDNKDEIIQHTLNSITCDNERVIRFMDIMKELVAANLVTKNTMQVYIELVTNEELRNKIRFITDGSYYSERIWANCLNREKLSLGLDIKEGLSLENMANEYPYVLLQVPFALTNTFEEAKEWIENELYRRDDDYYYDF